MKRGWLVGVVLGLGAAACGFGDNSGSLRDACATCPVDAAGDGAISTVDAAIGGTDAAAPDAATTTTCALVPQAGCTGATPACDLTAADDGTTECRAVTKQGNSDSLCAAPTECRAGYTCLDSDPIGTRSWCYRYCAADSDCTSTGTGSRCVFDLTDDNGNSLNVQVCSNSCDPDSQAGCPTGTGCLAYDDTGGDITDCVIMGSKADGQGCTADTECRPGSACINVGGVATCRSYCKVGVAGTCPSAQQCTSFVDKINLGAVEIGACL